MNDNRYTPPTAPVQDPQAAPSGRQRPREIMIAIQLAATAYVVGLLVMLVSWDYYAGLQPTRMLILNQVFTLGLYVWLYSKIYAGRNWARIVLLVSSVLGMLMISNQLVVTLLAQAPMLVKLSMIIGVVINLVTLWLLFLSPGREWFRKGA